MAKPGDTVYVMAGRYDERVNVKTSGAEGQVITFQAMPRRSAVVGGFDVQAGHIRIKGFEITADKPAVAVQLGGSHCEVLDNYIHDMMMGVAGTYGKPVADPNTRDYSAVSHTRIAYNKVYHSEYGFLLNGEDWVVENNEVSRLVMYSDPNLNYVDCDYTSTNGKILSNLFCDSQRAVLEGEKDFTPANPVIEYNLAFKTAPLSGDKNINGKDPLFVDAEKRGFRLKKGSPAVGAGKGGMTIGALEYPNVYYVDPRHCCR